MKLIVCLDDKCGLAFNQRRQSRDRVLIADLAEHVQNQPVWIEAYSAPLFEKSDACTVVSENPLSEVEPGDYCFAERTDPAPYRAEIDELILYRWNRHYPADVYFTLDLSNYQLIETKEFVGSSHEKITKEVWKK